MYIRKILKAKDAIRINYEKDIPDFLEDTIKIDGKKIICLAAEGYNVSPIGSVIGFDITAPTVTGKGAWPLEEYSYYEEDGKFYPTSMVRRAEYIKGPYSIETKNGIQTLDESNEGFLVTVEDDTKVILTKGTSSFEEYMVCTKEGDYICNLIDYKCKF